jgi:two-component system nitrate/nitrite response regulator NarL
MTAVETTSILLVEDYSVIATSLEMALRSSGFASVTTVDPQSLTIDAVLEVADSVRSGIVLIDARADAGRLGVAMVQPLVARRFKVLLFAPSDDPFLIAAGLRAGAEAIVDRSMSFERLVATLVELANGRQLVLDEERAALLQALQRWEDEAAERRRAFHSLTGREAEVMRSLVDGTSPKQIALAEGLSVSTIRGHIERIFVKLNVSSQREALALARTVGWPDALAQAGNKQARTGNFPHRPEGGGRVTSLSD